ncbi:hypothetical protein Tco_0562096, partial [Tanacetum coccineum]
CCCSKTISTTYKRTKSTALHKAKLSLKFKDQSVESSGSDVMLTKTQLREMVSPKKQVDVVKPKPKAESKLKMKVAFRPKPNVKEYQLSKRIRKLLYSDEVSDEEEEDSNEHKKLSYKLKGKTIKESSESES